MKEQWKVITMIIMLIFVVIFALQNTINTTIDFFFVRFEVPLVLVILFTLLLGVIIGLVTSMAAIQSNRKKYTSLEKEVETIKSEQYDLLGEKDKVIRDLKERLDKQHNNAETVAVTDNMQQEDINKEIEG